MCQFLQVAVVIIVPFEGIQYPRGIPNVRLIRPSVPFQDFLYVQSDFRKKYKILQKKRDIHLKTWYLKM